MASEFSPVELQELFNELRSASITQSRHERLESILQEYPEARQQWFAFCDVENSLKDWAEAEDARRTNQLPTNDQSNSRFAASRYRWGSFAAALLLAFGLVSWFTWRSDPSSVSTPTEAETPASKVAILTHMVDAQWQEDGKISVGALLAPSTIRLQSGALLIEFFSGATVVLEGPGELALVSKNKAHLLSGKMNAHVPVQAAGFTVETPAGVIVDHGTDFGVNIADDKPAELHVFEGRVELLHDDKSVDVTTGEAIRLGTNSSEEFDADRSAFLVQQELVEQSEREAASRLAEWQDASRDLSRDPSVLCHLRFDTQSDALAADRRVIHNSVRDADPTLHGSLVGGQWMAGRWAGKSGVLFGGPGDRIRLNIAETMKAISLVAWVNVQSLSRWQNTLLSSDAQTPGAIQWQLTKRGQLRLAIARDLGRPQLDYEAIESQPFLTWEQHHRWIMLATTFDGTTVRHYADGRPVGTGKSFTPDALHIDVAEIGNWQGETRRELHAILDEFIVVSRPLTEEELTEMQRYGSP